MKHINLLETSPVMSFTFSKIDLLKWIHFLITFQFYWDAPVQMNESLRVNCWRIRTRIVAGLNVLTRIQFHLGSSLNAPPALAEDIDFPAS